MTRWLVWSNEPRARERNETGRRFKVQTVALGLDTDSSVISSGVMFTLRQLRQRQVATVKLFSVQGWKMCQYELAFGNSMMMMDGRKKKVPVNWEASFWLLWIQSSDKSFAADCEIDRVGRDSKIKRAKLANRPWSVENSAIEGKTQTAEGAKGLERKILETLSTSYRR